MVFGRKKEELIRAESIKVKDFESIPKALNEEQEIVKEPVKQPNETKLNEYINYFNENYGEFNAPDSIMLTNKILFAIFCELAEIRQGNENARDYIKTKK